MHCENCEDVDLMRLACRHSNPLTSWETLRMYLFEAVELLRVARRDGDRPEQAEAHWSARDGVVPRRAADAKACQRQATAGAALDHRVHQRHRCARGLR